MRLLRSIGSRHRALRRRTYPTESRDWWLALCYDNYVLACQICNQSHKGERYPVAALMAEPAITSTATAAELDALLNTFAPDPLQHPGALDFAAYCAQLQAEDPD